MADAGRIIPIHKGDWAIHGVYEVLDQVYYAGSTYIAKNNIADSAIAPNADTTNWILSARGFESDTLTGITGTDTNGILGTIGATVDGQVLINEIVDRITTKLVNNGTVDVAGQYVLDAAYGKTVTDELSVINEKINDLTINVKEYGVKGDGVTDDYTALYNLVTSIATTQKDLFFPSGIYIIGTNITIPENLRIILANGAVINPNSTIIITINGEFHASKTNQCFNGDGKIYGIGEVYPEWWGAKRDGIADCSIAINNAIECMENSPYKTNKLIFQDGYYIISQPISLTPTGDNNLNVLGSGAVFGTRIKSSTSFSGNCIMQINGSDSTGTSGITNFTLKDFTLDYSDISTAPDVGLIIGTDDPSKHLWGLHESLIENVASTLKIGFKIINTRLIQLNKCSVWNEDMAGSIGIYISNNNQFCGDFTLKNCQFVPNQTDGYCVFLSSSNNEVKGIRFNDCVFYKTSIQTKISASGGTNVGDIWFNNCAFDGFSTNGVIIESSGSGTIVDNIQFNNLYARGFNGNAFDIKSTDGSGIIRSIIFNGGWFSNCNTTIFKFTKCSDITINGINMYEISAASGAYAEFIDTDVFIFSNNICKQGSAFVNHGAIISGTSNNFIVANNISMSRASDFISDTSSGTNKITSPNL